MKYSESSFFGYGWPTNNSAIRIKDILERDATQLYFMQIEPTRGRFHTVNMMMCAESDEERAAIWINSFVNDIMTRHCQNNYSYELMCDIETESYLFLMHRGFNMWNPKMTQRVPYVLDEMRDKIYRTPKDVISLVIENALLVYEQYTPILLSSIDESEAKESLRRENRFNID
jgi:hypothetical protein